MSQHLGADRTTAGGHAKFAPGPAVPAPSCPSKNFQGEHFQGVNISRGEYFSGVNIFQR